MSQRYTLSSIFRAVVTIDRDIIAGTNSHGEILFTENQKFQDDLSEVITEDGFFGDGNTGFFGTISSLASGVLNFFNDSNINNTVNANQNKENFVKNSELVTLTDIFDKKFFGWMVNFYVAVDNLAVSILYWFGSFALAGFIFQQLGLRVMKSFAKKVGEESNSGNMIANPWSKSIILGLVFLTFMMPLSKNIETNISSEKQGITTIIKSTLTVTSEIGEKFATVMNDIGSALFIKYVADNQNLSSEKDIERGIRELYTNFILAKKSIIFRDLCWSEYDGYKNQGTFVNADESWVMGGNRYFGSSAETFVKKYFLTNWFQENLGTYKYTEDSKKYGTFAISPFLCRNVENRAMTLVNRVVADDINIDNKIANVKEGKKVQAIELLINNSKISSEKIGWINVISKPVEYLFFKNADILTVLTKDNDAIKNIGQKYSSVTKENGGGGNDNKIDAWFGQATDATSFVIAKGIAVTSSMFIYNILPGFGQLQSGFYNMLEKSYTLSLKDGTNNKTPKEFIADLINNTVKNIADMIPTPISRFGGRLTSEGISRLLISFLPESEVLGHFSIMTVLFLISFILAVMVYNFGLQVLFVASISIFILAKVIFYYLELFKYIFFSLFVGLYILSSAGGTEKLISFVKDAGITTILKPPLIVLSMYMFIFGYELFITMYQFTVNWLIDNLETTFSIANVANMNNSYFFAGIGSYLFINTLSTMLNVLVHLFLLVVGYYFIIYSTDWVFSIVKHKDEGGGEQGVKQLESIGKKGVV